MRYSHAACLVIATFLLAAAVAVDVAADGEQKTLQEIDLDEVEAANQAERDLIAQYESLDEAAFATLAMKHAVDATTAGYVAAEAQQQILYAGAAYCALASPELLKTWSCASCKLAPKLTDVDSKNTVTARAYFGYDPKGRRIVVGFSGTPFKSISTWLANIDAAHSDASSLCKNCKAHRGFFAGYRSVRDFLVAGVARLRGKYPGAAVLATGHSLGGAQATYFMADAAKQGWKLVPRYYTFGAPRPGDPIMSSHLSALPSKLFRLVNKRDAVPHVPPIFMPNAGRGVILFKHPATEVFFDDATSSVPHVCAKDKTGENEECPKQMWRKRVQDVINAHMFYAKYDLNKHGCVMPGNMFTNFANDLKAKAKEKIDKAKLKAKEYAKAASTLYNAGKKRLEALFSKPKPKPAKRGKGLKKKPAFGARINPHKVAQCKLNCNRGDTKCAERCDATGK